MVAPAISYILAAIYAEIPPEILNVTWEPEKKGLTIDQCIIDSVIGQRVLMDTNLVGGKLTRVPLNTAWQTPLAVTQYTALVGAMNDGVLYNIPPDAREYRNITSVIKITDFYSYTAAGHSGRVDNFNNVGNTVAGLAHAMVSSRSFIDNPVMPTPLLLSDNQILVRWQSYLDGFADGLVLECMLEFDSEFTNIAARTIPALRNLVLCATKMYIYNQLRIKIDIGEVISGQMIGAFKEVVLSYEGEKDRYQELLLKFRSANIQDPETIQQLIRYMI